MACESQKIICSVWKAFLHSLPCLKTETLFICIAREGLILQKHINIFTWKQITPRPAVNGYEQKSFLWPQTLILKKKKLVEEGGWKRTIHQRQWHAQSTHRSEHARQHCSSFSTELRNITWKVYVPGKGITHSSETWWTCLQGCDFRELVADSPLGSSSELKFYFAFPTLHGPAWNSPSLARFIIC